MLRESFESTDAFVVGIKAHECTIHVAFNLIYHPDHREEISS